MLTIKVALFLMLMNCLTVDGCGKPVATEPQKMAAHEIEDLALSKLVEPGMNWAAGDFDISPDGRTLAVLYSAWTPPPDPSPSEFRLAIWNISSHNIVRSVRVASFIHDDPRDRKRVIFTADQSHIFVIAQKTLWMVDPSSGQISSVKPPNPTVDAPVWIQALSGAVVAITYSQHAAGGFYTELRDVSSAKEIAAWRLPTVPQSFSPDGKLAVALAIGEWNKGGVAGLQVVETATGAKLKSVAVGFGFKNRSSNEGGSAVARFLDNERILVSPDNMIDHTGNHSGYNLEVINIAENQMVGEIAPPRFVPTGKLVVSPDRSRFAVFSLFASPWAFRFESLNPKNYKYDVFVYAKDATVPQAVIEGINVGFGNYAEGMRFSADGSALAVGNLREQSIKVFKIEE